MLKTIRDWALPFVATFCGVFLAAYIAQQASISQENANFKELLRVVSDDTELASKLATQRLTTVTTKTDAREGLAESQLQPIRMPALLIGTLRGNPALLAKFDPRTFTELIALLPQIENNVNGYNSLLQTLQGLELVRAQKSERDENLQAVAQSLASAAVKALRDAEQAMRQAQALLQQEQLLHNRR